MLKIRMQRIGRIKQATFRIVVTEHTSGPKAGKVVEQIGTYNPRTKVRTIKADRVTYWMSVGAQPSDTMHNMLVSEKVIKGPKKNVLPKNKNKKAPAPVEVAAPAVATA